VSVSVPLPEESEPPVPPDDSDAPDDPLSEPELLSVPVPGVVVVGSSVSPIVSSTPYAAAELIVSEFGLPSPPHAPIVSPTAKAPAVRPMLRCRAPQNGHATSPGRMYVEHEEQQTSPAIRPAA
jgi:hypothetical protein